MPQRPQDLRHFCFLPVKVHPTLILCLWFLAVVLIQRLPAPWLALALLLSIHFSSVTVRQHGLLLVKRSRWLLAVLELTFFLMTPGEYLISGFPGTREGILLAGEHLIRLVAVLYAVAWLVAGRSLESLQAGLWGVAQLTRSASMKCAVARLSLTLKIAVDARSQPEIRDAWRTLLAELSTVDEGTSVHYFRFEYEPIPVRQVLLAGASIIGTAVVWWGLA